LLTFNTGDAFYALSRELIIHATGKENADIIATIRAAMGLPMRALWKSEVASFLEGRLSALAAWKEDDHPHLRSFACELSQQLQRELDGMQMDKAASDIVPAL